jgi:hypothetical protein
MMQRPRARKTLLALLESDNTNTAVMAVLIGGLLRQGKKAEAAKWLERLAKLVVHCKSIVG